MGMRPSWSLLLHCDQDGRAPRVMQPIVNAHTHLELGWLKHICPRGRGKPFVNWMEKLIGLNREAREAGRRDELNKLSIERGIAELKACGTTHVGDITQSGLSVKPLFESGLSGVVYIEVIGSVREVAMFMFERAVQMVNEFRPIQPQNFKIGITAHAPYSTHQDAIRASADFCRTENIPFCMHVAESSAEVEALKHGTGDLLQLAAQIGQDTSQLIRGQSPIRHLASLGVLDAKPLLIHMVHADDEELDMVAAAGAKIAHCPRSNALLQCGTFPLEKALARNIPVALGTDSLASAPSLNINDEARFAVSVHQGYVAPATVEALRHNTAVLI